VVVSWFPLYLPDEVEPMITIVASNTYDRLNQLIKIVTGDGSSIINTYNGEGLRVSKTSEGRTTYFLYEYDKVVLELYSSGAQKARNLHGTNLLMRTVGYESYYYLYNGHADVTALVNKNGNIAATYYYDAFGNILEQTGDVDNNITYSGYQYDEETGLYYLNARMYDPKIARFLQEDTYRGNPNDPLSLNLYTYCHNNPIVYWDPTGHWAQGDENLNDDAKVKIIALGNAWQAATTQDERDRIHQQAQDIRKNQDSWQTVDSNGNLVKKDTLVQINNVSSFDSAMIAAMSDGIISVEENRNAQKLIGATATSTRTAGTSLSPDVAVTVFSSTTIIGKSDININIKTAQSLKNTNIVTTGPANITITNHYLAYFFYNPRWTDQFNQNLDYLADYYGIDKGDIGTVAIGTDPNPKGVNNKEFENAWNSIGTAYDGKNVRAAVVFNHGSPGGIESIDNPQIQKLDSKNIDNLLLLNCNAGHLDHVGNNPASYFADKINGGKVMASDGTLLSGMNQKYNSGKGEQYWSSLNDENFELHIPDSKKWWFFHRNNKGFVIYQNNGQLTTSNTGNKKMSIRQMLDIMK
ncbi:MAG TPA: RHS repeat-associated core domain-containing protein, partial [Clostridiaceae bacterium]|nr:RHS repeat-associated core domain-containing protein [Clostridiaceae bacterium]